MKTFSCFSVLFLLIFTDICSANAVKDHVLKSPAVKGEDHAAKSQAKDLAPLLQAGKGECSKCPKHERPMDCAELMANGVTESGIYTVYPRSRLAHCTSIDVYCDMETRGGGWTVIQRRGQYGNGEDYFNKRWSEYKDGFGNLREEFWLGNENIYIITNQGKYAVLLDMEPEDGQSTFAHYENFWIENEEAQYKLGFSECSGPAKDALREHHGYPFYTHDRPNHQGNGQVRSGGWWRNGIKTTSLNGLNLYKTDKVGSGDGINWWTHSGFGNSFKSTEIKVRPKRFH